MTTGCSSRNPAFLAGTDTVLDEAELLGRARAQDTDALAQIHDAYYAPLFRYVSFRVSDRHTAEDLVSDVFTRFLTALRDNKSPQSNLRGWLFGVAANVVSDHHRRRYRAPQEPLDEELVSQEDGPAEIAEQTATREDLRRAVATLTGEQQHVLAMRYGKGLPIQEVARALGKTEGAIKQLQARAIAALARKMSLGVVE
jgi:RNA polymerase sigma-70 factor (ECF subfamily)